MKTVIRFQLFGKKIFLQKTALAINFFFDLGWES